MQNEGILSRFANGIVYMIGGDKSKIEKEEESSGFFMGGVYESGISKSAKAEKEVKPKRFKWFRLVVKLAVAFFVYNAGIVLWDMNKSYNNLGQSTGVEQSQILERAPNLNPDNIFGTQRLDERELVIELEGEPEKIEKFLTVLTGESSHAMISPRSAEDIEKRSAGMAELGKLMEIFKNPVYKARVKENLIKRLEEANEEVDLEKIEVGYRLFEANITKCYNLLVEDMNTNGCVVNVTFVDNLNIGLSRKLEAIPGFSLSLSATVENQKKEAIEKEIAEIAKNNKGMEQEVAVSFGGLK